ncbi:type II toxin-antitoxin system HipA family toxin [Glycomyces rhizosphaerae]|uniref:Type II toxin-antitoxin system HipA family toxin n=1 Tax=Glycomyces rhizosphaerae TaxID=2054422 RepID=A0ABV7Q0M0_9ACTN
MPIPPERRYGVYLYELRVGTLVQRGDETRFNFSDDYFDDPARPVLGLRFEQHRDQPYRAALRLPPWFSNLLPEGPLRQWVARDRDVSSDREMELLAQLGADLPGAIRVAPVDGDSEESIWPEDEVIHRPQPPGAAGSSSPWRFSFAGVALKFSMLRHGDRLSVPAADERGDWIVKFPDHRFPDVPLNEYAMMTLAARAGIEIPEVTLVHRDQLDGLPSVMWPNRESVAYAVRRFDRTEKRSLVHIEDFAQVLDRWATEPHHGSGKYASSFATVLLTAYRGHDEDSLVEATRRIAFNAVIGNGDAHLKNWSLIYRDRRRPKLSPAYDLVATAPYRPSDEPEDFGLKFNGSRRFQDVTLSGFERLAFRIRNRLGTFEADLPELAADVAKRVHAAWPEVRTMLASNPRLQTQIDAWIGQMTNQLQRR